MIIATMPTSMGTVCSRRARGTAPESRRAGGGRLGSVTGAPHGQANAVLLPHALAFNRPHVAQALQRASAVLPGGQDVIDWVARTSVALGVPTRLRDIGVAQDALAVIAQKTMGERGLYFNPRPVSHASEILALLQQAY
jgi:alcohol dehydrogenase